MVPKGLYHDLCTVKGLAKGRSEAPEPKPVGPISDEIMEPTIEHLCPTVAAMVRVQRLTGMRPGELVVMRACDLKMTGEVWEFRPSEFKTEHHESSTRIIDIGPRAQEIIKGFLRHEVHLPIFSPKRATAEQTFERRVERKTPLYPSHVEHQEKRRKTRGRKALGDAYTVNSYRRAIARACDRAFPHPELAEVAPKNLTPDQRSALKAWRKNHRWHPHQLRHSAGTAIREKAGVEAAQAVLGHAQTDTAEIYAKRSRELARRIAAEIG
jgi:integrase